MCFNSREITCKFCKWAFGEDHMILTVQFLEKWNELHKEKMNLTFESFTWDIGRMLELFKLRNESVTK